MKQYKRYEVKVSELLDGRNRFDIIDHQWDKRSTVFVAPGDENPNPKDAALAWIYGDGQYAKHSEVYQLETEDVFGPVCAAYVVPAHWFFI